MTEERPASPEQSAPAYQSSTKRIAKRGKRYLAKNMVFLTVGQFGTKILSFFLVPLYTNVLSSAEYGMYDLYSVTVSLFIPILTLNISDATLRFLLGKDAKKSSVISISVKTCVFSIAIFALLIAVNSVSDTFPIFNEYRLFLLLMFAVNGLNGVLLNIARGLDRIKDVSVSGVICSAVMIILNLIFLLPMHLGLKGYYLATISGSAVQILYLSVALGIHKFIRFREKSTAINKEMLRYSCPMMLNSVSWWVNSVSDRYIVTWFCGLVENGIYSVAYKIPSILTIFQNIFSQAWTLSAIQDFDRDDKDGFFSDMYRFYNTGMVLICSALIILTKPLAQILFAKDFYAAWRFVPFLLISTVFGALGGYIGGIFAATKKSSFFAVSSFTGAAVNILLNVILIKIFGTIGAAVATFASYFAVWLMRIVYVRKLICLRINFFTDGIAYGILLIQSVIILLSNSVLFSFTANILLLFLIVILYRDTIHRIFRLAKNKSKRERFDYE